MPGADECGGFEVPVRLAANSVGTSNPKNRTRIITLLVLLMIPKFAREYAAMWCELWNRSTRRLFLGAFLRPSLARRIDEKAEEIRVRLHQHARERILVGAQPRLIGLHRAIEGEEILVAAIRVGEDAVALGIAFAAD